METKDIKMTPKWSKSKDEIWKDVFADLEDEATPQAKRISFWRYAAAAVIVVAILGSAFAGLYTVTSTASRGMHLTVTLPDGSVAELNAESELRYKPCWWVISRKVELKGEAYFKVVPGSKFTVGSGQNEVNVLGTSFNVLARSQTYVVTCLTGKVEVRAAREKMILTPDMQFSLRNSKAVVTTLLHAPESISWTDNRFSFMGVPLHEVVNEVERQYDIHITTTSKLDYLYTGNFSKAKMPEEVLEIIGKPFGITFKIEP